MQEEHTRLKNNIEHNIQYYNDLKLKINHVIFQTIIFIIVSFNILISLYIENVILPFLLCLMVVNLYFFSISCIDYYSYIRENNN